MWDPPSAPHPSLTLLLYFPPGLQQYNGANLQTCFFPSKTILPLSCTVASFFFSLLENTKQHPNGNETEASTVICFLYKRRKLPHKSCFSSIIFLLEASASFVLQVFFFFLSVSVVHGGKRWTVAGFSNFLSGVLVC